MVFDVVVILVHLGGTPDGVVVEVGAVLKDLSFVDEGEGAGSFGSRLVLSHLTRLSCNCRNECDHFRTKITLPHMT
jgi:hypothetical protein